MKIKKSIIRFTAKVLIISMGIQLILPVYTYALTTGPSTPEVQSFEPVGTTEMVDMFTGDFTYNIPLMDVEGFPINISYHGGVNIEQEASWVGLGWNINPGEINRSVRGLPDDFKGETIEKELNIQEETNYKFATGVNGSLELFGFNPNQYGFNLSLGLGTYIAFNNYKGTSVGGTVSATLSTPVASAGIDVGLGSQTGADIDVNAGFHISQKVTGDVGAGIGVSGGTGFNSRTGLKDLSFGVSTSATIATEAKLGDKVENASASLPGQSFGSSIPIGMQNYVPVITNASVQNSFQYQARFGGEVFFVFPNVHLSIMKSTLKYEPDGSRAGYGYLYAENATVSDIMDFSREKDGYYNNTLKNLPLASMTYDVYSISGQGTGGVFRPFRNDIGTVYDPLVNPPKSVSTDVRMEGGIGNLFELGTDLTFYDSENKSGPWKKLPFRGEEPGTMYEKVFFKQAGEMTYNNQQSTGLFNPHPQYMSEDESLRGRVSGSMPAKFGGAYIYTGMNTDRTTRANLLTYNTAEAADINDILQSKKIINYSKDTTNFYNPTSSELNRYGTANNVAKKHHITEFTQTLPDGRRYIYDVPAMNNVTKEVTFGVNPNKSNLNTGQVEVESGDDTKNNLKGKEHFYSYTGTPAYAYSYLLSSVLSSDYVDIMGDGPTDDDLGAFTKFNYTKWQDDYRWRAPYGDSAQYNPGFWSDPDDDRGSYIIGSKEIWHIRSIETKNYIAEFYVSRRRDGKGVKNAVLPSGSRLADGPLYTSAKTTESNSYKLDSIKLYNKHDRYINEHNAVPIKTVIFRYTYRLCGGVPNYDPTIDDNNPIKGGKLTLERIYIKYGNSQKNLLSPYVFTYGGLNPNYSFASKDRWGNYKGVDPANASFEYPYVNQEATDIDANAGAWCLTEVKLPSGGRIHVDYESDDYAYVQNKRAMEMFKIAGVGSTKKFEQRSTLYENIDRVNNYVYFKRRVSKEIPEISFRNNYLEDAELLYYSFNMDISGNGKYEHIKGYASIADVGICLDDTTYGYVELRKEKPGDKSDKLLHPAVIYGLNYGKYYIPHIIYPGFKSGGGPTQIMQGLKASAGELMTIKQNPIVRFIEQYRKGKNIRLSKSWVRLNTPGVTKKGGGSRVKQLYLNDAWDEISVNIQDANYGKQYNYTTYDKKWGTTVSSGVASYEPMVGGDENPLKMPVKYTVDAGRLLPATEFFQEEPFGESFFPPPVVGYSKVTVKSIHANEGRSSQSEEEYDYYTAKDFPIEVDYTEKYAPSPAKVRTLRKKYDEVKVMQGYVLRFNDMHGKPRGIRNYVINTDGVNAKRELVSGTTYNYQVDGKGKLNNVVNAVVRTRGQHNTYAVQPTTLGQEMDFTVDTRERYIRNYSRNVDINANVVLFGFVPVPIPTAFFPDKEEKSTFRSMVTTKIMQQYGILKSVEVYDHGAKTVTENILYDAETGGVLLTKTNDVYDKGVYDMKIPAHWAVEGMKPAYTNINFEEKNVFLGIEGYNDSSISTYYGNLLGNDTNKYSPGDELLLTYKKDNVTYNVKVWVLERHWAYGFGPGDDLVPPMDTSTGSSPLPPVMGFPLYRNSASPYPNDFSVRFRVVPRFLFKNGTLQWPGGLQPTDVVRDVTVRVLRSGRRNHLDKYVQETQLYANPYTTNISSLMGTHTAYSKALNVAVTKYTDQASPYTSEWGLAVQGNIGFDNRTYYQPTIYPVNIKQGADTLKIFNRYVLGHRGNYRAVSNYIYNDKRQHSGDIKADGTFDISGNLFWLYGTTVPKIILQMNPVLSAKWIKANEITRFDVFGNAIEEVDAAGYYTSAQYGYNRALPVSVGTYRGYRDIVFDGFEDYDMVIPEYLRSLYSGYFYNFSPFKNAFDNVQSNLTRHNQKYIKLNKSAGSGGDTYKITNEQSHTGSYSLKCSTTHSFDLSPLDRNERIPLLKNFMFRDESYLVSLWFKPVSGGNVTSTSAIVTNGGGTTWAFTLKSGNVDGWYKAECILPGFSGAILQLPSNAYFDDIRIAPTQSTVKSFVYDPHTFRLVAQLDENHYATFYEYDQEGLLVRIKKETDKGKVTISENRRANSKKQ